MSVPGWGKLTIAAGPSNPMHVRFPVLGNVQVYNQVHLLRIDTPGSLSRAEVSHIQTWTTQYLKLI